MERAKFHFDWIDSGAIPIYDALPHYAIVGDVGWRVHGMDPGPFRGDYTFGIRPIVPLHEFYPGWKKFPRWFMNRVREVNFAGTFVVAFRANCAGGFFRHFQTAGVLFVPQGFEGLFPTHFEGSVKEAAKIALKAFCPPSGENLSRIHPAVNLMMQSMLVKREKSRLRYLETVAHRETARLLMEQGITPEQLASMDPEIRYECEKRFAVIARQKARARAELLLRSRLSEVQRHELDSFGHFHMTGSDGKTYRVRHKIAYNVRSVGPDSFDYCVIAKNSVPLSDQVLAQKLLLETNAPEFFRIANKTPASDALQDAWEHHMDFSEALDRALVGD